MSVETAMSRVLEAEKDAVDQLAASERLASDIVREARAVVRALVRRHRARITRLHAASAARTRELVAQLEQDAAEHDREPHADNGGQQRLREAVERLARELTEKGDAH